jgi:excisionase family DNA binding protein
MSCIESAPPLQTVAEYAAANNVCEATVYRLIAAGKLPARRLGRAIRIEPTAVPVGSDR